MALGHCEVTMLRRNVHEFTSEMHADDHASYLNAIAKSFVPLRITPHHNGPFHADIRTAGAGDVIFTEVSSKAQTVERTACEIARGGTSYYKVSLLLSGTSILVQDGRELVMQAGDLSVYDTSRPYSLLFDGDFSNLIMMFPKDSLSSPVPPLEQLSAAPLSAMHPLAPILSAFISSFPQQFSQLAGATRMKLADTSLDLAISLLSGILGVAAIGARWGFQDAAHFSRIFRAANGLSPTEFRRLHRESSSR